MKKNRTTNLFKTLILLVLILAPAFTFAQTKIGHVNTQKILELMPDVKAANVQLDTINKTYQAQMKALLDEYQKQQQDLNDPTKKYPDAVLLDKQKAFKALQDRIQAFRDDANSDIQKKQDELMAPIRKKISDAITAVAKDMKVDLILDSSQQGVVLYAADGDDLTDAVMKKLGIKQ